MDAAHFRRAQFAALKQLGWDDDDRRRMYADLKLPSSSSDFTPLDRAKVIHHLNKLTGYQGHPGKPKPQSNDRQGYINKIEALLADMSLPWAYAVAILKNTSANKLAGRSGVDAIEWASVGQLRKVVAALTYEQAKRTKLARVDELLARHGFDRDWVSAWLAANMPKALPKWDRNARTLNIVLALLAGLEGEG